MKRAALILSSLLAIIAFLVVPASSVSAHVQAPHHPLTLCYGTSCDGKYPAAQGCETANSHDIKDDLIYDTGGGIAIGVMHEYYDADCSAYHFGFNVNNSIGNCAYSNIGSQGITSSKDETNSTSPVFACPNHWLDSVMDEHDFNQQCVSAWLQGTDSYSKAYNHKLIWGGEGC